MPARHQDQAFVERLAVPAGGEALIARHCDTSCVVRTIPFAPGAGVASLEQPLGDWAGVGSMYFATSNWSCVPACAWTATAFATMTSDAHAAPSGPGVVVPTIHGDALMYGSAAAASAAIGGILLATGARLPRATPKSGMWLVQPTDHQGFRLALGQVLLAPDGLLGSQAGAATTTPAILNVETGAVVDMPGLGSTTPGSTPH